MSACAHAVSHSFASTSADETRALARSLAPLLIADDVVLLAGDLGAGKTQFVKGLAEGLGVTAPVTSPTFNILLTYEGGRLPLFHFDLYRLESPDELIDIDYFGTLESGGASVVEWGDRFAEAVLPDEDRPDEIAPASRNPFAKAAPSGGILVEMGITGDHQRSINVFSIGSRGEALASNWARAWERVASGSDAKTPGGCDCPSAARIDAQ
ncbi:MAG: tRNA (adenosine(37)-N6)-threonylcarbamoyltransferase complex ATPase subunit type 1 TsaE [Coriobacteriia bacterium]|nr:tRNA (adenosine(37)-N6)-threonylcarbamoyltransferase complex ATPase subunit type 1 TsaE [Coriobacteriia bacterium]